MHATPALSARYVARAFVGTTEVDVVDVVASTDEPGTFLVRRAGEVVGRFTAEDVHASTLVARFRWTEDGQPEHLARRSDGLMDLAEFLDVAV